MALASRPARARILRFGLVGIAGYLVDTGLLSILHNFGGWDPFSARLVSVVAAALTTWRLNRRLTFGASGAHQAAEGLLYAAVTASTVCLNYAVYCALLFVWPALHPVAAVTLAASVAMSFTYLGYSRFVFPEARTVLVSPKLQSR